MAGQGKGNFGNTEEHKKAGHLGGEATAREHENDDFYEEIGRKGGEARAEELGHEGFQELGHKGGEARKAQGADYSAMGSKGGKSQGKDNNPGNFANRPHEEVEEAARKGGQS